MCDTWYYLALCTTHHIMYVHKYMIYDVQHITLRTPHHIASLLVNFVSIPHYIRASYISKGMASWLLGTSQLIMTWRLSGYDDVVFFCRVRYLPLIQGLQPGPKLDSYIKEMSKRCDIPRLSNWTIRDGTTTMARLRGCSAAVCWIKKMPKAWHSLQGKRWTGLGPGWVMVLLVLVVVWFRGTNDQKR